MGIFFRDNSEYKNFMNPVNDYIKQSALLLSKKHNVTYDEAVTLIKKAIKLKKPVNPKVVYRERNDFGDRKVEETPILSYIEDVKKHKQIIAPSFTVYDHPDDKESILSSFTTGNVAERSSFKKKMFLAGQENRKDDEDFYSSQQNSKKVENNGLSGGFASRGTVLFNPSGHSSLTSTTRCVSGIGNAISESIVGGNKYFKEPDSIFGYFGAIMANVDPMEIKQVMDKYNLVYPTTDDILKNIKICTRWYWNDKNSMIRIRETLDSMSPEYKAAFLYVNDLWSIKELNDKFMRDIVKKLSSKVLTGSEDVLKDLNDEIPGTNILVHHIFAFEIKGLIIDYKKMLENNDPLVFKLASTAKVIKETLYHYQDFFKVFLVTDILPPNIQYVKSMVRFNIVLSDTDSTCCSYGKWVNWYFGEDRYDDEGIGVSAAIMTITTQTMSHYLKVFSRNINFGRKEQYKLDMKNEFMWPVFVTSDLSKHYFATTMIREGNVFSKNKLEKKGVHYISSVFGDTITKTSEEMMISIMDTVSKKENLYLTDYINKVLDLERTLLNDIESGKLYMYKKDTIKTAKSYKQEEEKSKYINYILWEEVFAPVYGSVGKPPYAIYTISLTCNNKTKWFQMLEEWKKTEPQLVDRLVKFCNKHKKDYIKTLRLPKIIGDVHGLPKLFLPYVDSKGIITKALISLYYVLNTLGLYIPDNTMLSEVIEVKEAKC